MNKDFAAHSPAELPVSLSRAIVAPMWMAALAGAIALAFPPAQARSADAANAPEFVRGRILIEARAGLSNEQLDKVLRQNGGGKRRKLGQSRLHVVELPNGVSELDMVRRLAARPELKFAELDRLVPSTLAVNDPYIGSAWHLSKVGAATAWDSTRGAGVTVAILDSGIDSSHPDLQANLVAGFNVYSNNTDVSDVCGHGTAVAGTAAAVSNNGIGVAGVAGAAKIMPVRIAYLDTASNICYASYSTIASGLTYAADHGARIANVSYRGVSASATVQSAARYLKGKGGLVFVSAGNGGIDENLMPDTATIAVSATDSNDVKTSWSSYGNFVSLAAPGASIWTTSKGGLYQAWNGTSFSSPLTAGVAALLMSARPDLDGAQVEQLLFSTAVDLGAAGRDPYYGYGRVDAAAGVRAALAYLAPLDTQAPLAAISAPLGSSSVAGVVAVNVDASDNVGVARVDLAVNGTVVATETAAPYGFSWDSTGVPNGMANLVAMAYDAAGNAGASATVAVNVANAVVTVAVDTTAPVVAIVNPVAGSVAGTVAVSASASDNSGAAGITQTLLIDGVVKASGRGGSLSYNWNTRKVAAGSHTLTVTAKDDSGNASSASVQVLKVK